MVHIITYYLRNDRWTWTHRMPQAPTSGTASIRTAAETSGVVCEKTVHRKRGDARRASTGTPQILVKWALPLPASDWE
jgi:hypothetical protein